jgi:hypothetical protein
MKFASSWHLPTIRRADNPNMNRRFVYAILTYAVLAILAVFTLDGIIRIATLVLLGGFALKTYLAVLKGRIG